MVAIDCFAIPTLSPRSYATLHFASFADKKESHKNFLAGDLKSIGDDFINRHYADISCDSGQCKSLCR